MLDFVVSTITGRGAFPVDMLRYDQASPLTGTDSERIAVSNEGDELFDDSYSSAAFTVRVTSKLPATFRRYESFGCKVVYEVRHFSDRSVLRLTGDDLQYRKDVVGIK
tara:strand:+ start:6060 stop:6383 length:324 start_codon:yes stop_codon:yes gene_type:complete